MNTFFSSSPVQQNKGLAFIRILIGASLVYHGCEMFDTAAMNEYLKWDMFKNSLGKTLIYGGKAAELLSGILLVLGLLTRLACVIVICTMVYITFFIGHGRIWYEDQYPFLFALFGLVFIFTGPGAASVDRLLFKK